MKILCITPIKHIDGIWEVLSSAGQILYHPYASQSDTYEIIQKECPVALFVNPNQMSFRLDRTVLTNCIKVICTASTGLHHIDVDYCENNNIKVISLITDYKTTNKISSTAELAFGLMLSLIRNIPSAYSSVQQYQWRYEPFIGRQLNALSVGIIGYGRLGSMMAHYCQTFGMQTYLCDPKLTNGYSLEDLVRKVDIVSLHVHLSSKTRHMINQRVLGQSKKGLYLINTSRGSVVDESAVIWALQEGILQGYATDVIEDELEDISKSQLIKASHRMNIIITPHIGGMTREAQQIAYKAAAAKLVNWIKGIKHEM
ncbi:hypothetical protein LCGC14_1008240 [marine sediment metagenome]|uniref:D-isomer specific 2-hydroxyacid dehydrogenase NAD-binding domain-containing protein n=1 Tax=marine sediment metagenome TaxID=412755 RepID=A0A0F9N146_9ZZZZ